MEVFWGKGVAYRMIYKFVSLFGVKFVHFMRNNKACHMMELKKAILFKNKKTFSISMARGTQGSNE